MNLAVPKKVFCSHRSVDKPAVEEFAKRLRAAGIDAWLDKWEIAPGDDFVASINTGLHSCDAGLVFFSSQPWEGCWFAAEVSTLTLFRVEHGRRLIPVLIDGDAQVPPLLKPLARRGIEDFQQIVDALNGRSEKPPLGPVESLPQRTRLTVRLDPAAHGCIDVALIESGKEKAREAAVPLPASLRRSFSDFLHGCLKEATRDAATGAYYALTHDLAQLGDQLGSVLFSGAIGAELRPLLARVNAAHTLGLHFEAADDELLTLPFEAARLDGCVLALQSGVTLVRVVRGAYVQLQQPLASPLKLLVAVGAPDEDRSANAVLDLEKELQGILDAVEPRARQGNAEVRFLEVGHPLEVAKALRRDAYHVLHLSGHGTAGAIELEDEDGAAVQVTAQELAGTLLSAGRNVPLVVLSCCFGGAASADTGALAVELVRRGVPFVLAMQTRVTDRYASDLVRKFYDALAEGEYPQPVHALAAARQQLEQERLKASQQKRAGQPSIQPEYATATLFCASEQETVLVDYAADRKPLSTTPVHTMVGPLPQLAVGELVGRRAELRRVLRVLRDHPTNVEINGKKPGVVITGIGGAGKSSVASRAMARLKEEGWVVAATSGRFSITEIANALGSSLSGHADRQLAQLGMLLGSGELNDTQRLNAIASLLQTQRMLLVLDNFEDNLEVGGGNYQDPATETWVDLFTQRAGKGKLLFTSRYPLPSFEEEFDHQPLPPLSSANVRKLLWRLPALNALPQVELNEVLRYIGGHPRMLEFLDGILRKGKARLPEVACRLRQHARSAGIDLRNGVEGLDEALRTTLLLGARDVLLDELLSLARAEDGDEEALLQCAVFNLPINASDLAQTTKGGCATDADVGLMSQRLRRLCDISLLTELEGGRFWVHRWTMQALVRRSNPFTMRLYYEKAAKYRLSCAERQSLAFEHAHEATLNLINAELFDEASEFALQITSLLARTRQTIAVAAFCNEVVGRMPKETVGWASLADAEAQSHIALGLTSRALERYQEIMNFHERRVAQKPDCVDFQRDLSVTCGTLGDLMRDLGQSERAREFYEKSLQITGRLAQAEPRRADCDYQRDLSIAYERLGDLMRDLGQEARARELYGKSLDIRQSLVQSEPERADYQRDLSAAYEKNGSIMRDLGQGQWARELYEKSLQIAQRLAQEEPDRANYQRDLSVSYERLGDLMRDLGRGEPAREFYEKSLDIRLNLAQGEPERADYQRDVSVAYEKIGNLMRDLNQPEGARELYEKSLQITRHLAQAEPERADYQRDLSVAYTKLGDLLRNLGQGKRAREFYEKSLKIAQHLARAELARADYQRDLSVAYNKLGDLLCDLGEREDACELYENSLQIVQRLVQDEPRRADSNYDLSLAYNKLGDLMRAFGRGDRARELYEKSLDIRQRLAEGEPDCTAYQRDLFMSYEKLGNLMHDLGRHVQARELWKKSSQIARQLAH